MTQTQISVTPARGQGGTTYRVCSWIDIWKFHVVTLQRLLVIRGRNVFERLRDIQLGRGNVRECSSVRKSIRPMGSLSPLSQVTTGSLAYHPQGCLTRPLLSICAYYEPSMPRVQGEYTCSKISGNALASATGEGRVLGNP